MNELKKVQESLKPFDRYFDDEVIEFLNQHSIHILTVEPVTTGKAFEPSFRLFCQNQTYFVKFSSYDRFSDSFLTELSELNRTSGSHLLLPLLSKNIASIKRQLNVYEWIGGNNLKAILSDASSSTIAEYGYRCGTALQKIHMKMNTQTDSCDRIVRSFEEYMARLEHESFAFINRFDYRDFFYKNCNILLSGNNHCFVHMDFKPKNIMLCNDEITVVDIDSSMIGNPWMDFYDKAFSLYSGKETFNAALIRAYFDDNISDDFWEFFKVLSIYALIQNTACLLLRRDTRYIRDLESYLWSNYNGFKDLVPKWMKGD